MATSKPTAGRPLSPHLQIYRPQISWVPSIIHRATGVAMGIGTLWLASWLIAAASGPESFAHIQAFGGSIPGRLVLFGFTASICFHMLNGIRHLFFDLGLGFEKQTFRTTGWAVVFGSGALTVLIWIAGYAMRGGH